MKSSDRKLFADLEPLGYEAGDTNLYRYVKNSPTNATDPTGLVVQQGDSVELFGVDGVGNLVKGAAAGTEQFMRGKTAVRIAATDFYITGSPQKGMWTPAGGTTSYFFAYKKSDPTKLYRLDYDVLKQGPNKGQVGWEHNQKGVAKILNVKNHQPAGRAAAIAGTTLKIAKHGGRALFVLGAADSAMTIYAAENRITTAVSEAGGWAGALAGAYAGAKGGAAAGAAIGVWFGGAGELPGAAIGGAIGSIGGGIFGFLGGKKATEGIVEAVFVPLLTEDWVTVTFACTYPPSFGGGGRSGGGGGGVSW